MKILTRYVTAELIKVFVLVLFSLTLLIMLAVVIQEAVRQGLGIGPILKLAPFMIPVSLQFSVPGATLLVASTVYGRMSASNEIVAVKSLGISPMAVIAPILWLGAALSLACVWLNDVAVSWGENGVRRVVVESVGEISYRTLATQKSYSSGTVSINVLRVDGRWLIKPIITILGKSAAKKIITITAEKGELVADTQKATLTIRLYDAMVDAGDGRFAAWPGAYEHVIPLSDFSRRGDETVTPSNMALAEIPGDIRRTREKIDDLKLRQAAQTVEQLLRGDFAALAGSPWKNYRAALENEQRRLNRLATEPQRRWANGLTCFCFALVGTAMAIRRKNGEFLASFFFCFLPILVLYYPLLALTVGQAKNGTMPPVVVWLGDVVLVVWGVWLMRRVFQR